MYTAGSTQEKLYHGIPVAATGESKIAKIPITFGSLLVIVGVVILAGSLVALLITVQKLGFGFPMPTDFQLITAQIQLSWFFIFFGSIMIFMGIRRISPA